MSKSNIRVIRALRRDREKMRALLANPPLPIPNLDIDYPPRKQHPSSTTTPEVRMHFQDSDLSTRKLARQFRKNPKTVRKWRMRSWNFDEPMGPKRPHAYSLNMTEEYFVKHYRHLTGFGLDDCLLRLRTVFPKLTRSSLYRCFKRHEVNNVPWSQKTTIEKATAKYPPGDFCLTVQRDGDEVGFFGAVEDGSGRVYCSRLPHSPDGAVEFLRQLLERFADGVKKVSIPHDEPIFSCSAADRREGLGAGNDNPFMLFRRELNLTYSFHYVPRPNGIEI